MKYAITIIIVLAALFGIQAYINKSQEPAPASLLTTDQSEQTSDATTQVGDTAKNKDSQTTTSTKPKNMNATKLEIKDTVVGTGAEAVAGKQITVNYTGKFVDGKVFDSSIPRGQPFTFTLGAHQVIEGWEQGFAGMKVGGKRTIVVPPELGYGMSDYSSIPGGSTLIFDVELLKVE